MYHSRDGRLLPLAAVVLAAVAFEPHVRAGDPARSWLQPCQALVTADLEDLEIQARRVAVLALDGWPFPKSGNPVARLIVEPAFDPDWVVSVFRPEAAACAVVATVAESNVWYANREERGGDIALKKRPAKVGARTYRVEIPCETANLLESVWQLLLDRQGPPEPGVFDGVEYTATSFRRNLGELCGQVQSPPQGSPAAHLAAIGSRLLHLVRSPIGEQAAVLHDVEEASRKLGSELQP